MRLPPAVTPNGSAGDAIEVSGIGLLLFSSPVGTSVTLGYAREQVTGLRNNALVIGAPGGFAGATPAGADGGLSKPDADRNEKEAK
jgi:hypothetical protein